MNNQQYAKLMLRDTKVTEAEKVDAAEEFLTTKIKEMYQSEELHSDASQRALRRELHLSFNKLTKLDSRDFDFQIMMSYSGYNVGHTHSDAMMKSNPPAFDTLRIVKKLRGTFSSGIDWATAVDWASVSNQHTHPFATGAYDNNVTTTGGNNIVAGTISAGDIHSGNIGTSRIMHATVGSIDASRVTAGDISATSINNANINATMINAERIRAHSITADHLATSFRTLPYVNIHNNRATPVDYSEQLDGDWSVTSMTETFAPEAPESAELGTLYSTERSRIEDIIEFLPEHQEGFASRARRALARAREAIRP